MTRNNRQFRLDAVEKCLAALSVQRTEGAGRREVDTKNIFLMCLESQDPNLQQDRSGDLQRVCRKRQFDQTTLCQHQNCLCYPSIMPQHVSICSALTIFPSLRGRKRSRFINCPGSGSPATLCHALSTQSGHQGSKPKACQAKDGFHPVARWGTTQMLN